MQFEPVLSLLNLIICSAEVMLPTGKYPDSVWVEEEATISLRNHP